MSISHKPHIPWGGVVGVLRRHRDDGEPTIELSDTSIHDWLTSGEQRAPSAVELAPAPYRPNTGPDDVQGVARMPFTVHRELDDDERFAERLLVMERETQSVADFLAADFDARMERLLARSRRFEKRWLDIVAVLERGWVTTAEVLRRLVVTRRRKTAITPLVPELGRLVESGDVSPASAAAIVSMRSRYLYALDAESQRLPRLTPELLAVLDAQKAAAA